MAEPRRHKTNREVKNLAIERVLQREHAPDLDLLVVIPLVWKVLLLVR